MLEPPNDKKWFGGRTLFCDNLLKSAFIDYILLTLLNAFVHIVNNNFMLGKYISESTYFCITYIGNFYGKCNKIIIIKKLLFTNRAKIRINTDGPVEFVITEFDCIQKA